MIRLLRPFWPATLSGQLLLALVGGLLAAQALTSTIWHDVRAHQALEVPTRVLSTRLADLVLILRSPASTPALIEQLQSGSFRFEVTDTAPSSTARSTSPLEEDMQALLTHLLAERLSRPPTILSFALRDVPRQAGASEKWTLDRLIQPAALPDSQFDLDVELTPGQWLKVSALEEQGWRVTEPWEVFLDYFVRIYLLRILLLVVVVLWAVRLVTRPIHRLASAAQALEKDLGSPPMPVTGPLEVRHAATAFNSMQRRLAAQLEERTRFLAAVSHDLRSPITRLRLRTEMLPDSVAKDRFYDDLEHMEAMVSATLEFVQSGQPNELRQKIDLNSMLDSMRQDAADLGHDVAVRGTSHRLFQGYPRSLKRCLDNVLENALRFGDQAELEICDAAEHVTIIVRDNGPGVPTEHVSRVTEPFYRVESSRNSATGGYGLGLSIARAVVESHAGRMSFHNLKPTGLEVRIVLPVSPGSDR